MSATQAEAAFAALQERFLAEPGVTLGTGFGSAPGLRVDGKIFAMLPHSELVVKVPAEQASAMVAAGKGRAFVVGKRTMREWLVVEGIDPDAWTKLAADALAYVRE